MPRPEARRTLATSALALAFGAAAAGASPLIAHTVAASYPHDRGAFTQGLQLEGGQLFESSGLYGQSFIRIAGVDGREIVRVPLPADAFAEGLALLGDRLYLLSWRERQLRVYDRQLRLLSQHPYPRDGWGLTHDGHQLIASDGSDTLHFIDPATLETVRSLRVREDGQPLNLLNELEWVEGLIFANVWMSQRIVAIDPASGEVLGHLELVGLLPAALRRADTDVLNGIAWDRQRRQLLVTGKRWPRLYALRLEHLPRARPALSE